MRLPAPLAIISALLLCYFGSCPSANSQTTPAKKDTDATVSGKVTIKGKPAPGVVVGMRLSQPGQFDSTFKATTDQEGNYRVTSVPAGSYEVAPVAPAFVIADLNNLRGQTVIITESEIVEGIDFELVRGGVITGKVTEADGSPVVGEHINLLPVDQRNQRGSYPLPLNFQTDDRGIYRMFGVRPGHYKVSIGQGDNNFTGRGRPAYATTFYPDATDSAKATVIEIDEGTEATKIDITLSPTPPGFSASGRVVDESGKPVANVSIGLSRIIIDGNNSSSYGGGTGARSDSQREFRLEKLTPGKYSISIEPPEESDLRAEPVTFDVVDSDVTGLVIKASRGASFSGVVVIEGAKDNSVMAALAQSYISAYIRNENFSSSQSARVKPDGSFRIGGLKEGIANFSLYAPGAAKRLIISRTERDGVVQSNGIQIQNAEQIAGIRVIVAYHNGSIRGVVKLENGTLPPGGRLIIQLATTTGDSLPTVAEPAAVDSRGHFLIEGLATGNYELTIMAYAPGGRQKPPSAKQAVSVTDGAATDVIVTIDLTPTPNP
jgi:5-hydroxyisourate hydrolase-like protein (transthyretin family)